MRKSYASHTKIRYARPKVRNEKWSEAKRNCTPACSILNTLHTVYSTLYTVHCILYTLCCTLYTVHCTVSSVHCTVYTIQDTQYIPHNLPWSGAIDRSAPGARPRDTAQHCNVLHSTAMCTVHCTKVHCKLCSAVYRTAL